MTPLSLRLYLAAAHLAAPAARLALRRRAARGKEDPARLGERMGRPSVARPPGRLLWVHAASVGEALAALTLLEAYRARRPDAALLLTTGTRTSAEMVAARRAVGVVHQYAPADATAFVRRFLAHWRPDVAARVDSELWPATLWETRRGGAAAALVNGRVSEASLARWLRAPTMAAALLGTFDAILAQDADSAARFARLGADPARLRIGGALKAAAPPPAADPATLAALQAEIGARPVWLAASTHPGEEALALDAAQAAGIDGLLTVIAPRHPDRGPAVAAEAAARGLGVARRGAGEGPGGAAVYVADTLGEMGLWLRLAGFAFIGGTVAAMGGHNPYEAAALDVALAHGPSTHAFADAYAALDGAAWAAPDAPALAAALGAALHSGGRTAEGDRRAAAAHAALAARDDGAADRAADTLAALTPPP